MNNNVGIQMADKVLPQKANKIKTATQITIMPTVAIGLAL